MAIEINVPDIGADEVEITEILVKVGDKVEAEQSLITVEGDKASMEVPAPFAGTVKEIKVNVEANHATLAGHSFHHEIATAIALGIFGSVDANRGDAQCGWDTDQFPVSVEENALVM